MKLHYFIDDPNVQKIILPAKQSLTEEHFVHICGERGCGKKSFAEYLIAEKLNLKEKKDFERICWLDCSKTYDLNQTAFDARYDALVFFNAEKLSQQNLSIITEIIKKKQKYIVFIANHTLFFAIDHILNQLCKKTVVKMPSVKERSDKYEMLIWFLERFFAFTKSEAILQIYSDVKIWLEKEFYCSKESFTLGILEDLAAFAILEHTFQFPNKNINNPFFDGKIHRWHFLPIDECEAFVDIIKDRANYFRKMLYGEEYN